MRVDILRYIRLKIGPILYERAVEDRAIRTEQHLVATSAEKGGSKGRFENFKNRHSLRLLFLVLVFSILLCGLLMKYVLLWFPGLHAKDMPLISSLLMILFLSPALYVIFYRPMIMQFDTLRIAAAMMQDLAHIDVLTGLYNRRGFLKYAGCLLKLADRTKRGLVLIYADLNNMKQINDVYGHEEGDRALVAAANVLRKTFRGSDIVARVGGDEFTVLALEAKAENLDGLRSRLNESLKKARYNVERLHQLTFSLGIVPYDPHKAQTMDELLKLADVGMYKEKAHVSTR